MIRSGHGGALVKALGGIKQRTAYAEDATRWAVLTLRGAVQGEVNVGMLHAHHVAGQRVYIPVLGA